MLDSIRRLAFDVLRIPPEPAAPAGAPGSLRVFRAAPNFYRLRLIRWAFGQVSAIGGLIIALIAAHSTIGRRVIRENPDLGQLETLIFALEGLGLIALILQMPVTLALMRLDYELRWYLVTDRSLRIRSGIWRVDELTMTFANIQEMTIHQGPLQRLLGIADLKVRSAGGGGSVGKDGNQQGQETHVAYFHGVDNAEEIRDLIVSHLKRHRDTGLGDPDAPQELPPEPGAPMVIESAREALDEARALRALIAGRPAPADPATPPPGPVSDSAPPVH